jgi:hypothetical protein
MTKKDIKRFKENHKQWKKIFKMAKRVYRKLGETKYHIILYDDQIAFNPKGFDILPKVISDIKKCFKDFKLGEPWSIDFPTNNYYLVRYNTNIPNLRVWVNCKAEDELPAGLKKEGCEFKEITKTEKVYVCERS